MYIIFLQPKPFMILKFLFFIPLAALLFYGCKVSFPTTAEPIGLNIEPNSKSFVLIDGGFTSATGIAIKKKREGVIKEVKNEYLLKLAAILQKQHHLNIFNDTTLTDEDKNKLLKKDTIAIANLSKKYNSAIVLILKNCYSGFRQDDVRKVPASDGTSTTKMASYSVFFDTEWIIVQANTINEKTVIASTYHSTRSIQSGLLARGPGFSANKEDILKMAEENAYNVSQLFKY